MAILINSNTPDLEKDRWGTQWECFYDARHLTGYNFILDACAEEQTKKVENYISPEEDALKTDWRTLIKYNPNSQINPSAAWCNPPFSLKAEFLARCYHFARRGLPVVALVPYERSTNWWREGVKGKATRVYIPDGRYNFLKVDGLTKKQGVNFLSCFVEFGVGLPAQTPEYFDFKRGIHAQPERLTIC